MAGGPFQTPTVRSASHGVTVFRGNRNFTTVHNSHDVLSVRHPTPKLEGHPRRLSATAHLQLPSVCGNFSRPQRWGALQRYDTGSTYRVLQLVQLRNESGHTQLFVLLYDGIWQ